LWINPGGNACRLLNIAGSKNGCVTRALRFSVQASGTHPYGLLCCIPISPVPALSSALGPPERGSASGGGTIRPRRCRG
jgi:hypothetical protein